MEITEIKKIFFAQIELFKKWKMYEEALTLCDKLSPIFSDDADVILLEKGKICSKMRRHSDAIECYNKFLEFHPDNEYVIFCKNYSLHCITSSENIDCVKNTDADKEIILSVWADEEFNGFFSEKDSYSIKYEDPNESFYEDDGWIQNLLFYSVRHQRGVNYDFNIREIVYNCVSMILRLELKGDDYTTKIDQVVDVAMLPILKTVDYKTKHLFELERELDSEIENLEYCNECEANDRLDQEERDMESMDLEEDSDVCEECGDDINEYEHKYGHCNNDDNECEDELNYHEVVKKICLEVKKRLNKLTAMHAKDVSQFTK